ncbi:MULTISPECIES: hypothetical protein [unclassified Chryseobacterium]|uniref:hypothetical protein n=1 Tax=unclassified Chryseobacterium TaxID=2593645 RepID=UPI002269BB01|nr:MULTISPECIES: hypothetical protein [unclassified Chryseobacterium]
MKKIILCLSALVIISCSNPMDKKYNESTLGEDLTEISKAGKMNQDEEKLMAAYLIIAKFRKLPVEGKTYSEILKDAKEFKEQKKFNN